LLLKASAAVSLLQSCFYAAWSASSAVYDPHHNTLSKWLLWYHNRPLPPPNPTYPWTVSGIYVLRGWWLACRLLADLTRCPLRRDMCTPRCVWWPVGLAHVFPSGLISVWILRGGIVLLCLPLVFAGCLRGCLCLMWTPTKGG